MLRRLILLSGAGLLFVVLTALTQLGGLIFLASLALAWALRLAGSTRAMAVLAGIVLFLAGVPLANLFVAPALATLNGRVALPCEMSAGTSYAALSPVYCALGRTYARAEVQAMLEAMGRDLGRDDPGLVVATLDANFPVLDGFPLPPHLSHDDGRRIDLAYFYTDAAGKPLPLAAPSFLGYWGFEEPPTPADAACTDKTRWLTFRWDMDWFQAFVRKDRRLDQERTAAMLRWLVEKGPEHGVTKILLEPHMVKRLGVTSPLIRFQGCRAARHDDHIHVEVGG
ncbi:hypothetical protein [Taklimakanibacter albus]|uniref:Uncharacterized protein n=1 Tax=Taklimakanibacter albus TaxID=2800327 RepID=A0ACC5R553_9HYPH|nr:hypothetical protein [Aestuariivirga sp. YIM B02566]MBK1867748.1 hypothetical protein [Aestuariivirga sp. YIM B02566]